MRTIYYKNFTDDVVVNKGQDYRLPDDYIWIRKGFFNRFMYGFVYFFVVAAAFFYCRFGLGLRVVNRKALKKYRKSGYYVFENHTQPVGDALMPALIAKGKRCFVIVSESNMGIPFLGKLLPYIGALPIPESRRKMVGFMDAVRCRVEGGNAVFIYPEAHVWPYYDGIRPFPDTSFRFPVESHSPSFAVTVTYRKRALFGKAGVTAYVDGPFFADGSLPVARQKKQLHEMVRSCMIERSRLNKYRFVNYIRREI
ncbi:MAG: hypothetical protein LKK19_05185 [Bacteroidales bacterium]|jgi:1-acyl-sn-glycerol-3-phosphate acyltransferase|nr:hypothetical protein [Bacteroidales bacterium]MCI2122077.1 hypothetical protein [Bacteroidales bacterium]MCI2146316.1 hypothetical protein [Bacteroidales bacterium]